MSTTTQEYHPIFESSHCNSLEYQPPIDFVNKCQIFKCMMTSSNGNIFRVIGSLWGEQPVTSGFPSQRPVMRTFDISLICTWTNGWANYKDAGELRRHCAYHDITVMELQIFNYITGYQPWLPRNMPNRIFRNHLLNNQLIVAKWHHNHICITWLQCVNQLIVAKRHHMHMCWCVMMDPSERFVLYILLYQLCHLSYPHSLYIPLLTAMPPLLSSLPLYTSLSVIPPLISS